MTEDVRWLSREISLVGEEAVAKIRSASVVVFGVGGVGGYVLETLCRAGIGKLTVVDRDIFDETNLNRQLLATRAGIGQKKTEAAVQRVKAIAPDCDIRALDVFVTPGNAAELIDSSGAGYAADCIDNVTAKLAIIRECAARRLYVVSCMGTGNKLDPSRFRVTDIAKTQSCPLARVMRRELRAEGLSCDAVWSDEPPIETGLRSPASISYVPPAAALLITSAIIKKIIT